MVALLVVKPPLQEQNRIPPGIVNPNDGASVGLWAGNQNPAAEKVAERKTLKLGTHPCPPFCRSALVEECGNRLVRVVGRAFPKCPDGLCGDKHAPFGFLEEFSHGGTSLVRFGSPHGAAQGTNGQVD